MTHSIYENPYKSRFHRFPPSISIESVFDLLCAESIKILTLNIKTLPEGKKRLPLRQSIM